MRTENLKVNHQRIPLTVIIPFRNEERNLANCLENLRDQNEADFKVICVNDHSTDASLDIFHAAVGDDARFTLHNLKHDKGKKAALELGIKHCETNWLITRDADTHASCDNLKTISAIIKSKPETEMIILPVRSASVTGLWNMIAAFEFHTLIASGLACAYGGIPIMANGANLAFTKKLFIKLEGYRGNRSTSSGDDVFLLQKASAVNPKLIGASTEFNAAVETEVPSSFKNWLSQRIRWGSKFRWTASLPNTLIALLVAFMNLIILSLIVLTLMDVTWMKYLIGIWIGKSVVDLLFAEAFESEFNLNTTVKVKLMIIAINPFLFILTILLSLFYRPKWKGRKIEV